MTGKMCPGRLRMTVDIVGCIRICHFLFSGEFLLNSSQLVVWDDSVLYDKSSNTTTPIHQLHDLSNIISR